MHILEEANGANHPDLAVCAASLARLLQVGQGWREYREGHAPYV